MCEILLRGKRKCNVEWKYGSYVEKIDPLLGIRKSFILVQEPDYNGVYKSLLSWYEVDTSTIGQFTGLTDSNGVKIFDGDCILGFLGYSLGVIRYGGYRQPFNNDDLTAHIGFYVDWVSGKENDYTRKDLGYWINRGAKVIGNIHDNPELLKGGGGE